MINLNTLVNVKGYYKKLNEVVELLINELELAELCKDPIGKQINQQAADVKIKSIEAEGINVDEAIAAYKAKTAPKPVVAFKQDTKQAIVKRKEKEWDNMYNEGYEGYNPYR